MNQCKRFLPIFFRNLRSWLHYSTDKPEMHSLIVNHKVNPDVTLPIHDTDLEDDDKGYTDNDLNTDDTQLRVRKVSFQTRSFTIELESGYPEDDLETMIRKTRYLIEKAKTMEV